MGGEDNEKRRSPKVNPKKNSKRRVNVSGRFHEDSGKPRQLVQRKYAHAHYSLRWGTGAGGGD